MRILTKIIFVIAFVCIQSSIPMQKPVDIYNNAKLIYHALGPKFHLPLEGIDPSVSISAMETSLRNFMEKSPNISPMMTDRMVKAQKSLARAKTNYLVCIGLVKLTEEPSSVDKMALELSQDAKSLTRSESDSSILFVGGHYLYSKEGSLGGHTATFDVMRQENGKLCYTIINTVKTENQETDGSLIYELVYRDLDATDLDADFWKNIIKINYMNPMKGKSLMESCYDYIDKKINKGSNKTSRKIFQTPRKRSLCMEGNLSMVAWKNGSLRAN